MHTILIGDVMNLIPCSNDCIYQRDGLCYLNKAMSTNAYSNSSLSQNINLNSSCYYYTSKNKPIPRPRAERHIW